MRALLFALIMGTAPAPKESVAVVAASADDPLVATLRGELGTLGFDAEARIESKGSVSFAELRKIARDEGVAAAIWIAPDRSEVVVWVDDRGNGRAIVRELPTAAEGATDEVIVLRVVELLRASLREASVDEDPRVDPAPEPDPEPEREVAPAIMPTPKPARPWWFTDFGPAVAGAPGGVGASVHAALSLRYMPHRTVGVRLAGLVPTLGPEVEDTEGSARVSVAQVVVGPHVSFRPPDRVVQPDAGISAGVSIVRVDGEAAAPFIGQTDHVVGFTGRLGAGVAFVLHPVVALRLDGAVGVTSPGPRVAFGGRTVARWGLPHGVGSVGVELRWGAR